MKKLLALLNLSLLAGLAAGTAVARMPVRFRSVALLAGAQAENASPQAGTQQPKKPQWKSTDEYNAYVAVAGEKDAQKKISLAEAFLQKFSNSDFKYLAHFQMMTAYQQLGQANKAVEEGRWPSQVRPFTHNRRHALYKVR